MNTNTLKPIPEIDLGILSSAEAGMTDDDSPERKRMEEILAYDVSQVAYYEAMVRKELKLGGNWLWVQLFAEWWHEQEKARERLHAR